MRHRRVLHVFQLRSDVTLELSCTVVVAFVKGRHTEQGFFSGINNPKNDVIITEVEASWLLSFLKILYFTEESVAMHVLAVFDSGPYGKPFVSKRLFDAFNELP